MTAVTDATAFDVIVIGSGIGGLACAVALSGSGAIAVTQNDRNLISAIDDLTRVPDPIAPSMTARVAVGRHQMRTVVYECDAPARFRRW